jgi:phosphomannomutase
MPASQNSDEYCRSCPGEEIIRISDAVCRGRRRVSYHKCRDCPHNDDLKERPPVPMPENVRHLIEDGGRSVEEVFSVYDIRGVYPEPLSEDLAWRIGHGAAHFLRSTLRGYDRSDPARNRLVVGRDMRTSSPNLHAALIDGVRSSNTEIIDIGEIDTPQLYFAINYLGTCGGVQITASHSPAEYNGIKISGQGGRPVGMDTGLKEIKQIAQHMAKHETGTFASLSRMSLAKPYRTFVRGLLMPPRPMKIVVDASNGMAGMWLPVLFDDVSGLDIVPMNFERNGRFVHDPNPLVESNLRQLQESVLCEGADVGACFDGDGDRCVFVDEQGQVVRCDLMTALLAPRFLRERPGSIVIYDVRSSRVVAEEITRYGGQPRRERVGYAFIRKAMHENDACFGGELSGHFYFRENWYCDSGMLALVHVLNMLTEVERPLSELVQPLRRYLSTGELSFRHDDKDGAMETIARDYGDGEIDHLDGLTVQYDRWWFNLRKSNTEPLLRLNIEADSEDLLEEKRAELASRLGQLVQTD